ncbi:peptidylprolyl isomerase [Aureimonas sp. SA4125]|uniref:SurA N-terminal domain-containing protein n=1 Tax=Aureimonas sp. SA4125 TaxID=2826993 RepID=UPI001CC7CD89|nr:SurA N-terminal domain-containing protein [Aureimonas sp. SA4125]BDA84685.1 peptidylprolyl isomerase [Aureimonas sp. SA4125]
MMNSLRKSVSGGVAKLLLGLIIIAFVVTGFSEFFTGSSSNTVITAGESEVTTEDYRLAYRQAEVQLSQELQRRPTREEAIANGIDQRVLSQLVAEAVLEEQGREIGLGLSEERLARLIADDPSFHDQAGRFSRTNFRDLLANVGMRENDFIRNREQAAVRSQIVDAISEGATAPELVKQAFGLYNGERRTADYLTIAPAAVQPIAEPADDVLQTYFDTNKQRYAAPEYRSIAYATLTPEAIADPAAVTEAEIKAAYDADSQKFTTPEQRRIQQIVYPDRPAAEAAKVSLAAGKTFDDLATASGRSVADTELGLLTKAAIPVPAIADAAFALGANAVSDVVDGTFGPVLLRVTEIQPEIKKPLAEVQEDIRRDISLQAASEKVRAAYDAYDNARGGGADLAESAKEAGLEVKTIPAISLAGQTPEGSTVPDLPEQQEILKVAFESDVGVENTPVTVGSTGFVFFDVTRIDEAHDRPLAEVKDQVVGDWKAEETRRLLGVKVEDLKKRLDAGETLDALAASEALPKQTVNAVTRRSGVSEIGADGVRALFSGVSGLVATADAADGQSKLLIKVTQVAPPADPMSNFPQGQTAQLDSMLANDFLQSYVNRLQSETSVVTYPATIRAVQASPQ